MRIGVLALQGAFAEHVATLRAIGVEPVQVRLPEQLDDVDAFTYTLNFRLRAYEDEERDRIMRAILALVDYDGNGRNLKV